MKNIILRDSTGKAIATGLLPESWADVRLGHYMALASAKTTPELAAALAPICNLPEEPLQEDVSLLLPIKSAAAWLFEELLPAGEEPILSFHYLGVDYVHVGDLHKINGMQFEALSECLAEHSDNPLGGAASLLAVLYCPKGKRQSIDTVQAAAAAFDSLPMSVAWPALSFFLRTGAPSSVAIQTYFALKPQVQQLLTTLERTLVNNGGRRSFSKSIGRTLTKAWIKSTKRML